MELSYVKGFFDRLCSVDVANRAIVLTIANQNLGRLVGARVRREGISCNIINLDDRVKLRVSGRDSLKRWAELVGFEDQEKTDKLRRILASYGGTDVNDPVA
jgi:hypothetical protein